MRTDGQDQAFECDQRTMSDMLGGWGGPHCKSLSVNNWNYSSLVFSERCCGRCSVALADKLFPVQNSCTSRIQCQTDMQPDDETSVHRCWRLTLGCGAHAGQSVLITLNVTVDRLVGLRGNRADIRPLHSCTYQMITYTSRRETIAKTSFTSSSAQR